MRVLLVSNLFPPYWVGGYEQIAGWVASGLRERGHEVGVLTGRGAAFGDRLDVRQELDLDLAAVCTAHEVSGVVFRNGLLEAMRRHVFSDRNFKACLRAIDAFRPELLSFWNPAFITFSPLAAARLAGLPSVVHLSDTAANVFRNPHAPGVARPLLPAGRMLVDGLLTWARPDLFVVPSAFLRDKFGAHERLPASRVKVLHWPVEPTISGLEAPRRSGARFERLLFVGALIPEKGPEVLLEAFRQAVREAPGLSLTFVGGGPAATVTALREASAGLPVRLLGRLQRDEVIAAYREHDVLVFPPVWDEPFAVVPLEGMAMGLLVIASSAGGNPEAVAHERTGLLVPAGDAEALRDAMLRVAAQPSFAESLAAAGQAWARQQLGFDVFMGRLVDLYAEVRA